MCLFANLEEALVARITLYNTPRKVLVPRHNPNGVRLIKRLGEFLFFRRGEREFLGSSSLLGDPAYVCQCEMTWDIGCMSKSEEGSKADNPEFAHQ